MIRFIMAYLERIGADQISFRKCGYEGMGAHLNIQVEELNDFNQNGYVMVTNQLLEGIKRNDCVDDAMFQQLENSYNYSMNDKSPYYEETCPNCGAVTGEYEVTTMGGTPDKNKRTCLRCECTWYGYDVTAEKVTTYIKTKMILDRIVERNEKRDNPSEKKDDMKT